MKTQVSNNDIKNKFYSISYFVIAGIIIVGMIVNIIFYLYAIQMYVFVIAIELLYAIGLITLGVLNLKNYSSKDIELENKKSITNNYHYVRLIIAIGMFIFSIYEIILGAYMFGEPYNVMFIVFGVVGILLTVSNIVLSIIATRKFISESKEKRNLFLLVESILEIVELFLVIILLIAGQVLVPEYIRILLLIISDICLSFNSFQRIHRVMDEDEELEMIIASEGDFNTSATN